MNGPQEAVSLCNAVINTKRWPNVTVDLWLKIPFEIFVIVFNTDAQAIGLKMRTPSAAAKWRFVC